MKPFAILPAAGLSRRMGRSKLDLPWRDSTVIEHVITTWLQVVDPLFVVIRRDDQALTRLVRKTTATVVQPDRELPQMRDSIEAGLEYAQSLLSPAPNSPWLMSPADTPTLSLEAIKGVLAQYDIRSPEVLVAAHGGKRGHPLLLPWRLKQHIFDLPSDVGLNKLLDEYPPRLIEIDERGILEDMDSPDDYESLRD